MSLVLLTLNEGILKLTKKVRELEKEVIQLKKDKEYWRATSEWFAAEMDDEKSKEYTKPFHGGWFGEQ